MENLSGLRGNLCLLLVLKIQTVIINHKDVAEQTVLVLLLFPVARKGASSPERPVKATLLPGAALPLNPILNPASLLSWLSSLCSFPLFWLSKFGLSQCCGGNTAALKEPTYADSEPKGQISTVPRTEDRKGTKPLGQACFLECFSLFNLLQLPEWRGQGQLDRCELPRGKILFH